MAYTIAVAGKGGSGKTTLACLLVYHLIKTNRAPVLAVDADPNANFNLGLGFEYGETIADLREEALGEVPTGMPKTDFVDMRLQESVIEGKDVDLMVMGRPEGRGCYCAVNHLLRKNLGTISKGYKYVVMDNEAGMEHLSRRTTDDVDLLLFVSEPTVVGLRSALNAFKTTSSITLKIKKSFLVINKSAKEISAQSKAELEKFKIPLTVEIPYDENILRAGEEGKSLLTLPEESSAIKAVKVMMQQLGIFQ